MNRLRKFTPAYTHPNCPYCAPRRFPWAWLVKLLLLGTGLALWLRVRGSL